MTAALAKYEAASVALAGARRGNPSAQLTQARLRELLSYDTDTGHFTGLVTRGKRRAGSIAGVHDDEGYVVIRVDYVLYKAHRLAWLYVYGDWPAGQIDHINGRTGDNRLCNLREATSAENGQNRKTPCTNTSGFIGVSWHKRNKKWQACIGRRYLGRFTTIEEARDAYRAAKAELHQFHPTARDDA